MAERRKVSRGNELRRRAEARITGRTPAARDESERLLHELQVHQIELELQNEELRASRHETETLLRRYAELFDFAPIGFVRLDAQERILETNFAAARLLARERRRLIGRPFHALIDAPAQAPVRAFLAAVRAAGTPEDPTSVTEEVPVVREGGAPAWLRLTGVLLSASEGNGPVILLSMEDVTARRNAEEALRDEARHKDNFLAALSHELRNPLAPIRNALSLLRVTPPGSERAAASLGVVERQAAHLSRIVDDLLDVTRISRGKIRLERGRLELTGLVRSAVEDHRLGFEQVGVEVAVDAPAPVWVDADASRLLQVFGNLLGNALKFTPREGHVTAAVREVEGQAVLRVRDDGIGIPPEVVGQLFVPFSQGPQGLDRSRGGLGLGLATARGLVELHGGAIEVRSEGAGRGAEFVVRLPAAAPPDERQVRPAPAEVAPLRVLVIEDNEDAGETLRNLLELAGHEVRVAPDGPSGLGVAHDFHPDLVLCDLGLPRMSGFEVARALRADEAARGALLVALSGYTQGDDARRAGESGFDHHVPKPASPEVLDRLLSEAARHAHAARP